MASESLLARVLHSLRNSCFGSDELQAYTATYSWLSNQTAHAAMGFFLAVACAQLPWVWARRWRVHLVLPFLVPVLKLPADHWFVASQSGAFPIPWDDFWDDKGTDLGYWFVGMLFAQVFIALVRAARPAPDAPGSPKGRWADFGTVLVLFVAFFGLGFWNYSRWADQKGGFDRSGLPSGWVRLYQFDTGAACHDEESRKAVEARMPAFAQALEGGPRHCVIRGGTAADRTRLAVALGTEFAARRKAVYYFTANKVLERSEELKRWERFATPLTDGTFSPDDPRFPRCAIIDDLPEVFPAPNSLKPVPVAPNGPYDTAANSQRLFNWFDENRGRVSTVWVLSCDPSVAKGWLEVIRNYACRGHANGQDTHGTPAEREEGVLDIDLGTPPTSPP